MIFVHHDCPTEHSTEAGWIGRQALLMTGINSMIYVLSTVPTSVIIAFVSTNALTFTSRWYLVDHWGRRAILLSGAVIVRVTVPIPC
jgi:hypothetical protein